ncbi:Pkinase-domain-containing protein [Lindgomyces ingoldianus]|uniref:Pkinase-domain-containing protein n=1 Tax=Lindgomyces ingoldianus TaxID=673940 RepID=A0ACB6Q821_9PLEO|nr:Pkinase-domain-containing protein [Lindgomyces ingoldianus]KAF2463014.1 Pkinase-domain-containing protein [Lindgomyces ingoldianus]
MEDEATQPATQQVLDPRRLGRNNSGLNEKDVADVLAILHPASPGAIKIVEDAAEHRPQHVLFRNPYDSFDDNITDIEEQETIIINRPGSSESKSRVGNDIALRMSSPIVQPNLGFVFGRNPRSTDILFGQDSGKRISNQHFRIFLNNEGVLMLEDMSTNGTIVDDILLKSRDQRFSKVRMLASGSIICIHSTNEAEMIKFVVRIPSRVAYLDRFQTNLENFLTRCITDKGKLETAIQRMGKNQFGGPSMKWDGGSKYNIIGLLGKGAFATVHQLATKMEGKLLAAKELEKRRFMKNGLLDKKIDNEMKIMQGLRHPNIVEFVEYHDQGDYLYIIMEFVRLGDLQGYLNQHGSMKEPQAKMMAQQILSALTYLHRMKITHRDIKPDNILIADLNPFKVKLSDFGLSKVVTHNETFLKTFCGTLLYCAPEVFPDFDTIPSKGTKRRRGTKQEFHSYSSAVDIWSFAGVIWYALCGKPPFEGIADATGRAMYNNIMTTRLDPTPLREAHVSEPCIDLLCKMLQTDPDRRPTERQCLNHPWLKDGAAILEDPSLQSIAEEDESEEAGEQLSQLNLLDDGVHDSEEELEDPVLEDDEFEQLINTRQSKKVRLDPLFPRNQLRDCEHDSSADVSFRSEHLVEGGFEVEAEESFKVLQQPPGRARLFGEIGQSALQSSGILSAHANEALSNAGSSGDALPTESQAPGQSDPRQTPPVPRNLDGAFSSPSLLGAESMVRELNMASPQSPRSGAHTPNEPATPKTPDMSQHNSLDNHNLHQSQFSDSTPKAKPPTFNRQISLPRTASFYYDPYDPSTHNLEYASKVSGFDFLGQVEGTNVVADAQLPDTMRVSTEDGSVTGEDVTQDATTSVVVPSAPAGLDIKPPPRRLGKLTATSDSFVPGLTLAIDRNKTSWGRYPGNTIVYENGKDTRVPKTAFVIFWYKSDSDPGAIDELSQKGKDWTKCDNLHVGIFTCATSGISVNGKHIRQKDDKGRALFGHLHTGDIIQVYHDAKGTECLKFKCEFYHGSGKEPRPPGEGFNILIGTKNFWALPAFLRIALASQHTFSVFDDLLAFPQYEVIFPNTYLTDENAASLLAYSASRSTSSVNLKSQETQELSKPGKQTASSIPNDGAPLEETYEAVVLGGQRYLCSIPVIPEELPQNSTASAEQTKAEEEKELMRANHRGWELLEGMQGNCIYYLSGWWSYSFCYKDEIKQFHQLPPSRGVPLYPPVEDTDVKSFVLGRFPQKDKKKGKEARKTLGREEGSKEKLDDEGNVGLGAGEGVEVAKLETRGTTRYMVQRLSGGTECDLTGKERKIEVQFHCHPQSADKISMIKETSTCSYLMVIYTPRLCNDVAFLPPQENFAHPISCQPVIAESEIDAWTAAQLEDKAREADRLMALENENPFREMETGTEGSSNRGPVIGGIEVGAHVLVGSEGKIIEKSVVVGGGKEVYVGTVASSDGTQMSVADMKKLNIRDPKDVETMKRNLQRMAGRKGWKLDLVDTPKGREFRGIIEAEDQNEKEGGRMSEEKGRGMRKDGEAEREKQSEEENEQDGSEEVYKDEL